MLFAIDACDREIIAWSGHHCQLSQAKWCAI
jgi:hypothetical protein